MNKLTVERLKELAIYDPETGVFVRCCIGGRHRNLQPGTALGTVNRKLGYVMTTIDKQPVYMHRLAYLYMTGEWPAGEIDHINGNRTDNRWTNLRVVSRTTNMENLRGATGHSKSGVLGVSEKRGKWSARIKVQRKQLSLGTYETAQLAHEAYLCAKRRLHSGCTI